MLLGIKAVRHARVKMKFSKHAVRVMLLAGVGCAAPQICLGQDPFDTVRFQSLSFPGTLFAPFLPPPEEGRPVTTLGILRMPDGADRVPAVVLTHGCSGITGVVHDWARSLRELGVATLIVNSFSGRGITQICSGQQSINVASVLADVYRALNVLAANPRIDASRIAIMGFSFGGRTALWASHPRFRERYGSALSFAAHLAFYPAGCYIKLVDEDRMDPAPVRIFHGTADDWTPIGPCREYVARLRRAGKDVAMFEYPGARHAFDSTALPAQQSLPDAVNTSACVFVEQDGKIVDQAGRVAGTDAPCVVRGASIGYSPDAHREATADVRNFLGEVFRLK